MDETEKVKQTAEEKSAAAKLAAKKAARKQRVVFGTGRRKLDYPSRPGFVRRVVNDVDDRLADMLQGGWEYVTTETLDGTLPHPDTSTREGVDSRISRVVGRKDDGSHIRGYLLEIEEELYQEDQAAKQARIDLLESGLRQGRDEFGVPGEEGRYVPKHTGIKIEHGAGRKR